MSWKKARKEAKICTLTATQNNLLVKVVRYLDLNIAGNRYEVSWGGIEWPCIFRIFTVNWTKRLVHVDSDTILKQTLENGSIRNVRSSEFTKMTFKTFMAMHLRQMTQTTTIHTEILHWPYSKWWWYLLTKCCSNKLEQSLTTKTFVPLYRSEMSHRYFWYVIFLSTKSLSVLCRVVQFWSNYLQLAIIGFSWEAHFLNYFIISAAFEILLHYLSEYRHVTLWWPIQRCP